MLKKMSAAVVLTAVLSAALPGTDALALTAPQVSSRAAVLMEKETGTVLFAQSEHEKLSPASVTKVMTLLLVAEDVDSGALKLADSIMTSANAASKGGSQIYLSEGERMSVEDLIKSVAIASANDAAVVLAEHMAGSEEAFVSRMNDRARELGMADTVFYNCTGLPGSSGHLTSAYDIALMSRELLKHDFIKKYTTIWMDSVRNGEFGLSNTNRLVRFYSGTTGLKTGFTDEAKYCVAATAERSGIEFIAVIMRDDTSTGRFESAKALLDFGFANYTLASVQPDEALPAVPVKLGVSAEVQPVLQNATPLLIEKSAAPTIKREVVLAEEIKAPVNKGQVLGELKICSNDKVLSSVPLVAADGIEKLTTGRILRRFIDRVFTGGPQT